MLIPGECGYSLYIHSENNNSSVFIHAWLQILRNDVLLKVHLENAVDASHVLSMTPPKNHAI